QNTYQDQVGLGTPSRTTLLVPRRVPTFTPGSFAYRRKDRSAVSNRLRHRSAHTTLVCLTACRGSACDEVSASSKRGKQRRTCALLANGPGDGALRHQRNRHRHV